jgi:hypothetical protein
VTLSGLRLRRADLGDDKLWGVVRRRKGGDHTLAALKLDEPAEQDLARPSACVSSVPVTPSAHNV